MSQFVKLQKIARVISRNLTWYIFENHVINVLLRGAKDLLGLLDLQVSQELMALLWVFSVLYHCPNNAPKCILCKYFTTVWLLLKPWISFLPGGEGTRWRWWSSCNYTHKKIKYTMLYCIVSHSGFPLIHVSVWNLCFQGPDGDAGKPGSSGLPGIPGNDVSVVSVLYILCIWCLLRRWRQRNPKPA